VSLAPGNRVGPYEVISLLGAGGMGEVYRARDTRLGREVALKLIGASVLASPELVRRFEQEARIAGSLNHPNLVAVYDVGFHDGEPYFVTELLQGESLRSKLSHGPVPLLTGLDWAAQMAHGLAAAHQRGIVHRDVKPENAFVGGDGQVKLLDFGIAKLAVPQETGPRQLMDATVAPSGSATRTGSVLGSPGYMSPEQVRGEPLDARTDIFSLGAVLSELVSGRRAFPGSSVVESGYAILHHDPEPLPEATPPEVAQVVRRCLEKEPDRRFQSASDLAFALEVLRGSTGGWADRHSTRDGHRRRGTRAALLLAPLALLAALGTVAFLRGAGRGAGLAHPDVQQLTHRLGSVRSARFAPDGRVIFSAAFEGRPEELFSKSSASLEPQSLGLTDVRLAAVSSSADLALLLKPRFTRAFSMHGTLARVGTPAGAPRELVEDVEAADWSPSGELALVHIVGGTQRLEYPAGHVLFQTTGWLSNPRFSAHGDRIAFLHHPLFYDDSGELMVVDLQGQAKTLSSLWMRSLGVAWAPDDSEILFGCGTVLRNQLLAVSSSGASREINVGPEEFRLEDVARDGTILLTMQMERSDIGLSTGGRPEELTLTWGNWATFLAKLTDQGKLLFSENAPTGVPGTQQPIWALLRAGQAPAQLLGDGSALDLSPDERWALVSSGDRRHLVAFPTGAGQSYAIDLHDHELGAARWLRDGKRLVATCRAPQEPDYRLCSFTADGAPPTRVSDVSVTGRRILHLSPEERWVATLDADNRMVLVKLRDSTVLRLPEAGVDAVPRGWSSEGHLWVTRGGEQTPARAQLIRFDVEHRRVVDERTIAPTETSGALYIRDLVVSPDGRLVAFTYGRSLGYLYQLRGILRPAGGG
jgi:hypothetical protein